eukprot:191125-Pelagomonas_calceolata.AAC.5
MVLTGWLHHRACQNESGVVCTVSFRGSVPKVRVPLQMCPQVPLRKASKLTLCISSFLDLPVLSMTVAPIWLLPDLGGMQRPCGHAFSRTMPMWPGMTLIKTTLTSLSRFVLTLVLCVFKTYPTDRFHTFFESLVLAMLNHSLVTPKNACQTKTKKRPVRPRLRKEKKTNVRRHCLLGSGNSLQSIEERGPHWSKGHVTITD